MSRLALLILPLLCLAACFGPPRRFTEPSGVAITRDLLVTEVEGRSLYLDIYRADNASEVQPVVLWLYGGGWIFGSRSQVLIAGLALRGYTVAAVDYRLAREAIFPAALHDVKAALRYLRAEATTLAIDPERIGVWGVSAGGHLAALMGSTAGDPAFDGALGLATGDTAVRCVVAFFPPTDLPRLFADDEPVSWKMRLAARRLLGGDPTEDPAAMTRAVAASPATHIGPDNAPLLIIHGDADPLIPVQHSRDHIQALRAAGAEADLVIKAGFRHGNRLLADASVRAKVHAFLDRHLQPNVPPGAPE